MGRLSYVGSALAVVLFVTTGAAGQSVPQQPAFQFGGGAASALTVPLSCRIENSKVLVITNSTGANISAGTTISYDAIRLHTTVHYTGSVQSPQMAPGAFFRIGAVEASTCTASFRRPAVLSQ